MFDSLSNRLDEAWRQVQGVAELTPENVKAPLKEIRRALLEADVSLPVAKRFIKRVEERALGASVVKGVTPDQQLVKVVSDELTALMGGEMADLNKYSAEDDTMVILMAGLQGVGKTTACGKLANYLKKKNIAVTMVAADVYRPAAIDQLKTLGERLDVPVFSLGTDAAVVDIVTQGVAAGRAVETKQPKAIIVDTAGRLQIDADMMTELQAVKDAVNPTDTLLVVDAMTGQEAASLVKTFDETVELTGAILTKMDGDSRGGAALSTREVSGKPIKFIGTGEKMDNLEPFYPERMAGRILGMGDVLTLVEKAEDAVKDLAVEDLQQKMLDAKFDLNDYLELQEKMAGVGSLGQMMKMLPGMSKIEDKQLVAAEKQMKKAKTIIQALTPEERADPDTIVGNDAIYDRVAGETGFNYSDVNDVLAQFLAARDQMAEFVKMQQAAQAAGGLGIDGMNMPNSQEMIAKMQKARKVSKGMVRRKKKSTVRTKGGGGFGKK